MFTRRHFIATTAALFSAPISAPAFASSHLQDQWAAWDAEVTPSGYDPATTNPWGLHPRLLPTRVEARAGLVPGDIHVDAIARYLYHIQADGTAMRYGVAIGRDGLYEPGTYTIRRKAKWPSWTPTPAMIEREPEIYAKFADGMDPGPANALGSRALYLFVGEPRHLLCGSTAHRFHVRLVAEQVRAACAWSCHISTICSTRSRLALPRISIPQKRGMWRPPAKGIAWGFVSWHARCASSTYPRVADMRFLSSLPARGLAAVLSARNSGFGGNCVQIGLPSTVRNGNIVVSTGPTWRYQ